VNIVHTPRQHIDFSAPRFDHVNDIHTACGQNDPSRRGAGLTDTVAPLCDVDASDEPHETVVHSWLYSSALGVTSVKAADIATP